MWYVIAAFSGHTHLLLNCTSASCMAKIWRNIEPAQVENPLEQVYLLYAYNKTFFKTAT